MTERLTPRTLDLEVRDSSLARRVVSLDKELYSTLSLFTQVCKWVPAKHCLGVTLQWTSIPSRRSSNTPRHASCYGNRYKLRPCGPLACVRLYFNPSRDVHRDQCCEHSMTEDYQRKNSKLTIKFRLGQTGAVDYISLLSVGHIIRWYWRMMGNLFRHKVCLCAIGMKPIAAKWLTNNWVVGLL